MTKSIKTATRRHIMRFDLGGPRPIIHHVKVVRPKSLAPVPISLTSQDVLIAVAQKGHGDASRCAGAVCGKRHGHLFPHPVLFIDWTPSRAYVVTKLDKNGMPSECVTYIHRDEVASLFDRPSGYKQLLKQIDSNGGELKITLTPAHLYARNDGGKKPNRTGSNRPLTAAERAARSLPRGIAGRVFRTQAMVEAALTRKTANARVEK